ncbi:MAG: WecB/TagA/CpsF family glycosyltransferase [Candidatus Omnitrophota bacterium]|jgi:N-acetylglucosaminyldiphosphoundecaprenol N-acetyl-beta-D-mannosaminyltransferase
MEQNTCINISGMKLDIVQIKGVIASMEHWIKNKIYGNYIVVANANDLTMGGRNVKVLQAMNASALTVADGFSLILLARLYGYQLKKRVYGPDLMLELLRVSETKGYSHFFYGSTDNTLNKLTLNLRKKFPRLKITGFYSPPFRELTKQEDEQVVNKINESQSDFLWIGLGCPKQQLWMYEHRKSLKVPVMIGVGAAFDFFAATKPQAPRWIRDNGFEWLFRFMVEPGRLWKRYFLGNLIFLWFFAKEFLRIKLLKKTVP